jgi:hypothetical protein
MGLMDYDARFYSQSLGRFLQPDTIIPNVSVPQTWNRYSYAINNPTKFTDPSGHFIETAFDVAMILVDVADIAKNGLNVSNGAALVLDVAAVIIPGVPAVAGLTIKAAKAANAVDNAMDTGKALYRAADAASGVFNPAKLNKILTNLKKEGVDVIMGSDIGRELAAYGKEAMYLARENMPGKLFLSDNPSSSAVIEELIHLGQDRNSGWKLFEKLRDSVFREKLEIEAGEKLLKIGNQLNLPLSEIAQTAKNTMLHRQKLQRLLGQ